MGKKCVKVAASKRSKAHVRCYQVADVAPGKGNNKKGGSSGGSASGVGSENDRDNEVSDLMDKAFESGGEVNDLGQKYADKYGGTVTPINYKSRSSINRKFDEVLNGDPAGTIMDVKDSVRNTVVVKTSDLDKVRKELLNDPQFSREVGGRVKFQDGPEYYGYKGIITNFKTKNGITAEIQFNTPGMIYAKVGKKDALSIMSERQYNNIFKKTGVKGGKGHDFYDEIQLLKKKERSSGFTDKDREDLANLINESEKYYANFYGF